MTVYFSGSVCAFYPDELIENYKCSGTLPSDLIEITKDEEEIYFCKSPPEGKSMSSANGRPTWADIPPPSMNDMMLVIKNKAVTLLYAASAKMAPLQDAVDLQVATDSEVSQLAAWKLYRINVNRVSEQAVDPASIIWPVAPE